MYILELIDIYKSRALNFAFRKLQFNMVYNVYSNKSTFKYHISFYINNGYTASF